MQSWARLLKPKLATAGLADAITARVVRHHDAIEEALCLHPAHERNVPLSAFIWVHAQSEKDPSFQIRVATRGAWVEFDAPKTVERHTFWPCKHS